jgi:predicted ATP-grasp superfamily ATP-dependent carboligase
VVLPDGDPRAAFASLLGECEAALVIAPETGGELARLSAAVEAAGVRLLGSRPAAVTAAGDKAECARRFLAAGLPAPRTQAVPRAHLAAAAQAFGYPLVLKPRDGVGCEGVSLAAGPADLEQAQNILPNTAPDEPILLQSYLSGVHASVSLLAVEGQARPLSLNGQKIEPGAPFTYRGGVVPLEHRLAERTFEVAQAAAALIPGLQGYLGIDFVLTEQEAWVIEINPRLTTSYLGLRQVLPFNLMQAVWEACTEGVLPEPRPLVGRVSFEAHNPDTWFDRPVPGLPHEDSRTLGEGR